MFHLAAICKVLEMSLSRHLCPQNQNQDGLIKVLGSKTSRSWRILGKSQPHLWL